MGAKGDPGAQGAEKLDGPPCGHSMGNATPRIHYKDHRTSRFLRPPMTSSYVSLCAEIFQEGAIFVDSVTRFHFCCKAFPRNIFPVLLVITRKSH